MDPVDVERPSVLQRSATDEEQRGNVQAVEHRQRVFVLTAESVVERNQARARRERLSRFDRTDGVIYRICSEFESPYNRVLGDDNRLGSKSRFLG